MNSLAVASKPLEGSSAMINSGSWIMLQANFVACFIPVEKLPIFRYLCSPNPTYCKTS